MPHTETLEPKNELDPQEGGLNRDSNQNQGLIWDVANPLWVSVSEAAKLGGVQAKTIRRAIEAHQVKFQVKNNRYLLELGSVLKLLATKDKLKRKFTNKGLGQYFQL